MFFIDLLIASIIAVVLAGMLSMEYRRRGFAREKAWTVFWALFLLILLEAPWLSMVMVGAITALLVMALIFPPRPKLPPAETRREDRVGVAIGIFFWLALVFLTIAIVGGYWEKV
jgi:uncharacterized membrane protein